MIFNYKTLVEIYNAVSNNNSSILSKPYYIDSNLHPVGIKIQATLTIFDVSQ